LGHVKGSMKSLLLRIKDSLISNNLDPGKPGIRVFEAELDIILNLKANHFVTQMRMMIRA
jgi:hypothetical protein